MMESPLPSDEEIMRGLNANPQIKHRIATLLAVVQDAAGDLKVADAVEMRLIEEIRLMGQEAVQSWAIRQVEQTDTRLCTKRQGQSPRLLATTTASGRRLWRGSDLRTGDGQTG